MVNEEDLKLRKEIAECDSIERATILIAEFYHNLDRADRTDRSTIYLHLGMLIGMIMTLTKERVKRNGRK